MPLPNPFTLEDQSRALDAYLARQTAAAEARPAPPEAVRAFDARITAVREAGGRELTARLESRGASLRFMGELSLRHEMPRLGRTFLRVFDLHERLDRAAAFLPVVLCETLDEFILARLERYHLSEALRRAELTRLKAEDEALARAGGGTLGVYLSGRGSLLNGWYLNYGQAGRPRDLLRAASPQMPVILRTAVHEALGHGFLAEFSALGREHQAAGIQDWEYARRYQTRAADTAEERLRLVKLNLAFGASTLLEEGWATWMADLWTPALLGRPRQPRYTLARVWEAAARFPGPARWRQAFYAALHQLFLQPPADREDLWWTVRFLQAFALDWEFTLGLGQPLAYVLGSLLLDQLEAQVGLWQVPAAVLIAANVTLGLDRTSAADLETLLGQSTTFNPDWRLAAFSTLPLPPPATLAAVRTAAEDKLSLAIPPELRA